MLTNMEIKIKYVNMQSENISLFAGRLYEYDPFSDEKEGLDAGCGYGFGQKSLSCRRT